MSTLFFVNPNKAELTFKYEEDSIVMIDLIPFMEEKLENVESGEVNKTVNIDYNTLTIDVAEFTKDIKYMTKNGAYTIRICDNVKFKPVEGVKGSWKIQDSDFYIKNPNSAESNITPIRSGNDLELQFFVEGYSTPLKRTIVVKEQ